MKLKFLMVSFSAAALILSSGCGGKEPVIDETNTTNNGVKTVQTDTANATTTDNSVNTQQDSDTTRDSNEMSLEKAEDKVETVLFDFDKFFIRSDMREIIEKNAEILKNDTNKNFRIKIEGNCDEWGSDEYNYALGLKRATSAKKALVAQGVDAERMTLVSYGEANPVCTDKTQACWSKNRRVDFKVLP